MNEARSRYPGAQPFADDDDSRKIFFGRNRESQSLTDQIIASRHVVVYGRSGLGKSSLLNAGVAQRLRDEGCIPLNVRINVPTDDLVRFVIDDIKPSRQDSDVEYQPGKKSSLWHFFKTAEFWRKDRLLTPVLVLDQFEELFTLHPRHARESLLESLGYVIRGIPPPHLSVDQELSETAPDVRIVLSLREEFLGHLEEASDRIPQILDQRFRILPLSLGAATEALVEPARLRSGDFATPAFTFSGRARQLILGYLSRRRTGSPANPTAAVEPFQLQLICHGVEERMAKKKPSPNSFLEITAEDLGGRTGLAATLGNFYRRQVATLEGWRTRKRVRRLCEEHLITPQGRRTSMEASEIGRLVHVDSQVLSHLVNRRLLRSDQRAEAVYYELSHDTLIAPVLASRRGSHLFLGTTGLIVAATVAVLSLFFAAVAMFYPYGLIVPKSDVGKLFQPPPGAHGVTRENLIVVLAAVCGILLLVAVGLGAFAVSLFRKGSVDLLRYSHRGDLAAGNARATRMVASVIAFALGALGIHKFFLGYYLQGLILLGVTVIGFFVPWHLGSLFPIFVGIIESIIYFAQSDEQFVSRYLEGRRAWF
jgi:TM2 domain-containing membrane protein YozV